MREHLVGSVEDLAPGGLRRVDVDGRTLCVARTRDGEVHAIDGLCTHEAFPLDEGEVIGGEVECPQHGSRFDLRTGEATELPAEHPARVYPVEVREGMIYIIIDR